MNLVRQAYLEGRVLFLERKLSQLRDVCASNLRNPGNEGETLEYVVDVISYLLGDEHEYEY